MGVRWLSKLVIKPTVSIWLVLLNQSLALPGCDELASVPESPLFNNQGGRVCILSLRRLPGLRFGGTVIKHLLLLYYYYQIFMILFMEFKVSYHFDVLPIINDAFNFTFPSGFLETRRKRNLCFRIVFNADTSPTSIIAQRTKRMTNNRLNIFKKCMLLNVISLRQFLCDTSSQQALLWRLLQRHKTTVFTFKHNSIKSLMFRYVIAM